MVPCGPAKLTGRGAVRGKYAISPINDICVSLYALVPTGSGRLYSNPQIRQALLIPAGASPTALLSTPL